MTGNSLAYYQELHEIKENDDGLLTEKQHIVVAKELSHSQSRI